jgi:hypothetical protein
METPEVGANGLAYGVIFRLDFSFHTWEHG